MKNTMRRVAASPLARWSLVAAWATVIFAGSSIPGSNIPGGYSVYGHLGEYFVLAAFVTLAIGGRWSSRLAIALLVCALYAASDEFHQAFVPMRTPDPIDWLTDMVGAAAGAAAMLWWTARRSPRTNGPRQ